MRGVGGGVRGKVRGEKGVREGKSSREEDGVGWGFAWRGGGGTQGVGKEWGRAGVGSRKGGLGVRTTEREEERGKGGGGCWEGRAGGSERASERARYCGRETGIDPSRKNPE